MPKKAAGFVIFRKLSNKIEYLLLQTSYGEHHWTPPKGHVDPGEDDVIITAYRETQEESGLEKTDLNVLLDTKRQLLYDVNGNPKTVSYWLAELVNTKAKVKLSHEHQDFKWLEFSDACSYAKYQDFIQLLTEYNTFLLENKK